jgi:hypothetical protein
MYRPRRKGRARVWAREMGGTLGCEDIGGSFSLVIVVGRASWVSAVRQMPIARAAGGFSSLRGGIEEFCKRSVGIKSVARQWPRDVFNAI